MSDSGDTLRGAGETLPARATGEWGDRITDTAESARGPPGCETRRTSYAKLDLIITLGKVYVIRWRDGIMYLQRLDINLQNQLPSKYGLKMW